MRGVSNPVQGAFLVGFTRKDGEDVAAWFHRVEPGFPVSHCSEAELLNGTLGAALYSEYPLGKWPDPHLDPTGTG